MPWCVPGLAGDVIVLLHVIPREASTVSTPPVHAAASIPMGSLESLDLEDELVRLGRVWYPVVLLNKGGGRTSTPLLRALPS